MDRFVKRKNVDHQESGPSPKKQRTKKYFESYLDFGFIEAGSIVNPLPKCVLCLTVLSNENMKPSKLKRHLEKTHSSDAGKPREFFQRKMEQLGKQQSNLVKQNKISDSQLEASYRVSLKIARAKKPHTIGENLIKPAATELARIMLGEDAAKILGSVPLSNNTIQRRIQDMGSDCKDQLIEDLKKSDFALQLDESTDIANQAQLLVYVRYLNSKNEISEEMLFSHEMEGRTTGECIFNVINSFFYENGLQWEKCCSICTDGAASMTGRYSGFLAHAKDKNAKICATHCIIHREHLAAKTLSEELHSVLNDVVKIVNFIKGRALNARLFRLLCQEMGADHEHLLYHSGVRWLSRGKVLSRVFELLSEVTAFLESAEHELVGVIKKRSWKIYLAYLADIYGKINELNLSLQGRQKTMIETVSSVRAFQEKIKLWMSKFTNGHFYIFPTLNSVIDNDDIRRGLTKVEKCCIINHLEKLGSSFSAYFKYDDINYDWIVSPFT